jgi:hypothetical protein
VGVSIEGVGVKEGSAVVGSFVLASVARPLPHPKRFGLAEAGDDSVPAAPKQVMSIVNPEVRGGRQGEERERKKKEEDGREGGEVTKYLR